jgi:uncharacterized protein
MSFVTFCFSAMALFRQTPAGVSVTVRVTPRAGKTAIAGVREDVLLVKLAAAPVDGAANDALVALLADIFALPKRNIAIVSGDRSRTKHVTLGGASATVLDERLRNRTT